MIGVSGLVVIQTTHVHSYQCKSRFQVLKINEYLNSRSTHVASLENTREQ